MGPMTDMAPSAMKSRLLLADPQALVIEALRSVLRQDFLIVDAVEDGESLIKSALTHRPDLVLLELSLPRIDGLAAIRALRVRAPEIRCMVVSMYGALHRVRAAFAAGASGYVLKEATPGELIEAARRVIRGETHVSPQLRLGDEPVKVPVTHQGSGSLTERQRQVLRCIAAGRTGKQIASELGISLKTVESHKACISRQLGLRSTAALTRFAIEQGLARRDPVPERP